MGCQLTCMRVVNGTDSALPGCAIRIGRDCSRARMKEHSSARMTVSMSSLCSKSYVATWDIGAAISMGYIQKSHLSPELLSVLHRCHISVMYKHLLAAGIRLLGCRWSPTARLYCMLTRARECSLHWRAPCRDTVYEVGPRRSKPLRPHPKQYSTSKCTRFAALGLHSKELHVPSACGCAALCLVGHVSNLGTNNVLVPHLLQLCGHLFRSM